MNNVKEPAYKAFIERINHDLPSINECHTYLSENNLEFTPILHTEFWKNPTYFRDETEVKVFFKSQGFFDFYESESISVRLLCRKDGYYMDVGSHPTLTGYIGAYAITKSFYEHFIALAETNDYKEQVDSLFHNSIDFVDFSKELYQAYIRVNSTLSKRVFFKRYFGLDDTFIDEIISNTFFWS